MNYIHARSASVLEVFEVYWCFQQKWLLYPAFTLDTDGHDDFYRFTQFLYPVHFYRLTSKGPRFYPTPTLCGSEIILKTVEIARLV